MKVKLERIKNLRTQKGWTQDNMAHELGITQPQYGRLENGENEFDFEKITKIIDLFQVNPLDIIDFEEKQIFINSYNGTNTGNSNSVVGNTSFTKEEIIEIVREEVNRVLSGKQPSI